MSRTTREISDRMRAYVGETLPGGPRIDALLALGGTSAVFAATSPDAGRVAVKMLYPALAEVDEIRARFLREANVANRIEHRGVVRVRGTYDGGDAGMAYLLMELLEGNTLADTLLERRAVIARAIEALDVLASAHEAGVVHRDVKPQNLFVTRAGALRVLDFGLARLLEGTSATRSGQLLGTPAFMPPEQAAGRVRDVDARSDVWSMGAVVFTLLTGRHVHAARTAAEQIVYAATRPAPPLAACADVHPEICGVVDRALAFDRRDRWPSAADMRDALAAT